MDVRGIEAALHGVEAAARPLASIAAQPQVPLEPHLDSGPVKKSRKRRA